jgi:hypothetical protein
LQVLQQIQLEAKNLRKVIEEIQKERLEMQRAHQLEMEGMRRAHQLEMEGMQRAHRLEMEEMQRTSQLEMEEMERTFQLEEEGTQDTHQPRAEVQRHRGEVWKPGDDGLILARVGGANFPADGGGTAPIN